MNIEEMKKVLAEIARLAEKGQEYEDIRQVRQIINSIAIEAALVK